MAKKILQGKKFYNKHCEQHKKKEAEEERFEAAYPVSI
jgi:hypothetical protein